MKSKFDYKNTNFQKRRKALRLKEYDYSQDNIYFITTLTRNRVCYFGNIENDKSILNEFGKICLKCWLDIPVHFKVINLLEFIIMPNHLHGLIEIKNEKVRNAYMRSLQDKHRQNYRTKMTLSKVIQQFKSSVSRKIRLYETSFQWQKSFYDHIIRNEEDLIRIQEYINYNPMKWNEDEYYN